MSTIDNRVVKMAFDNSQFEKNATTSIHTLEKLKQALNFKGATKGLSEIQTQSKAINLDPLISGVQAVSDKFNALGVIGFTVLQDLTRDVVNFGKRMASAITIDPIKMGFSEYETQINAVQTILANTQDKLKDRGLDEQQRLDLVNEKLDELNLYADKTIYNFTEMTRNIGTFTAAGVELETATNAIQGIANLAAVSGSTSQQASTAMYQLSQALASGTVKLMDWNSVVNAGMGGEVFQKELKDTARAHGVAVDDIIAEQGSFRESLSEGWITSEILTETLEKFTATTEGLTEAEIEQQRAMWRGRGYTEEQIDSIFELGKMSTDAATKVKTFTQLIDTLKEALQSGWTQSWEYIIGDFQEAKELWTSISDVLGDYIGKSADARNAILKDWSEAEGGRKAVIQGLWNAFNALVSIMTTVKQAFSEVFPPITAQQLIDISTKFKDFTNQLALNEESLKQLKEIVKQVFTSVKQVTDGVINIVTGLASIVKTAFQTIKETLDLSQFLNMVGLATDIFLKLTNILKPNTDQLAKLKNLFEGIASVISVVSSFLIKITTGVLSKFNNLLGDTAPTMDGFYKTLSALGDALKNFSKRLDAVFNSKDMQTFTDNLSKLADGIGNFFNKLKEMSRIGEIGKEFRFFLQNFANGSGEEFSAIGVLNAAFEKLSNFANDTIPKIIDGFTRAKDAVVSFISEIVTSLKESGNLDMLTGLGISAAGGFGIVKLLDFMKSPIDKFMETIDKLFSNVGKLFDNLDAVKNGLLDTFGAIQSNLKADTLKSIAIAIAILVVSLLVLTTIDADKLLVALGGIAALMGGLTAVFKLIASTKGSTTTVVKAGSALIMFAAAVLILAAAVKILSTIDPESLVRGLGAVAALLAALVGTALALSKMDKRMAKGAGSLVLMAIALRLLVKPVQELGALDLETLGKGILAVTSLLAALAGSSVIMKFGKMGASAGLGMLLMAVAIRALVDPIKEIGSLDYDTIQKGLISVLTLILALGAASAMTKGGISDGIGFILMAKALEMLVEPVKQIGSLNLESVLKGVGSLVVLLFAMAAAMNRMPKDIIAIAFGITTLAGAMKVLGETVVVLGNLSLGQIVTGLLGLGGALAILAIASTQMKDDLGGAIALSILAAALVPLAAALSMLAAIPILGLVAALAAVALTFVIFGAAATILAPLVPVMTSLAGAMMLFGVAAALFAISFAVTALTIATSGTVVLLFLVEVMGLLPLFASMLGRSIVAFATAIGQGAPAIGAALLAILTAILTTIRTAIPMVVETLLALILELITMIAVYGPLVTATLLNLLVILLAQLATYIPVIVSLAIEIITGFLNTVAEHMPEIVDSAFKVIIGFIDGLAEAIENNHDALFDAVGHLIQAIIDAVIDAVSRIGKSAHELIFGEEGFLAALEDAWQDIFDAGANLVQGFIDGITSMPGKLWDAACGLANDAWNAITGTLDEHSPSRLTFGGGANFTQGFINGMVSLKNKASAESAGIAIAAMTAFDKELDSDYQPKLTPVMDLTNIQNGVNSMNGMFDAIPSVYEIDGEIANRNQAAAQAMQILGTPSDYTSIVESITALRNDLTKYNDTLSKMQIVMDTGVMVGALTPGIDRQLGRNAVLAGRGV